MDEPNILAGKNYLDFIASVEAIIKRSCIVDYGIVQRVVADGVVDVAVAVSDTPQNMYYLTCVLANTASSSLTINIKPNVGDRVLVVYPRIYDEKMFAVPDGDKKTEVIVNKQAKGYNLMSGIAILLNQYKESSHKNVITVDNGTVEMKLAYDEQQNKNLVQINIDNQGNVTVNAQGKYTFKNATNDLLSVISDLNTILKGLKTTGSQSAQTISADTVAQLVNWENTSLKALLST